MTRYADQLRALAAAIVCALPCGGLILTTDVTGAWLKYSRDGETWIAVTVKEADLENQVNSRSVDAATRQRYIDRAYAVWNPHAVGM